jgi:hypothetical protein
MHERRLPVRRDQQLPGGAGLQQQWWLHPQRTAIESNTVYW